MDDPDRYWCAVGDYARAVDRSDVLQSAWQRAGRPATAPGGPHGHVEMPHPLLTALERAEDHNHALAASLGGTACAASGRSSSISRRIVSWPLATSRAAMASAFATISPR